MILLLDNYDSFTYNIYQYLCELGAQVEVVRNDAITVDACVDGRYCAIVISPGPGDPDQAGISLELIRRAAPRLPVLGVCLGHQAIVQAFGGKIVRAPRPIHGKTSPVEHQGDGVFLDLPSPFDAGRYHSLVAEDTTVPDSLVVNARIAGGGLIMGVRHREYNVHGIQFHPESVLTQHGHAMLRNFLALAGIVKERE